MNSILFEILNEISEGIIILNENLNICLWNSYMEHISGINKEKAVNSNIYAVLPNLGKSYFKKALSDAINNGNDMFFSAVIHRGLVNDKENLNLKISRFQKDESKFLLLEFINVTNQLIQISKLESYVKELCKVNKELKEKEQTIKDLAYYDKLTGVANRTLFYELAEKALNDSKRSNNLLGLMFIDVDKFKSINDTYGHEVGDKVLVKVAGILKKVTRKNDIVARYGGDEFLILLPYIKNVSNYEIIVSRIVNNKNKVINLSKEKINISLSMGISFYPDDGDSIDKLIVKADKAMYIAKNKEGQDCSACISGRDKFYSLS